jgi:hypothetical protein
MYTKERVTSEAVSDTLPIFSSLLNLLQGSTVVYPYSNSSLPPLELGASIFVPANKNLWRAAEEFNLTREDNVDDDVGIWDGDKLLVSVSIITLSLYGVSYTRRFW